MKMKKVFLSLAVIAVLFTACTKEDCNCPEPTPDNELSGDISTSVTLDASIEYKLVGTLRVKEGGTLNIPAGTTIKAESGFSNSLSLSVVVKSWLTVLLSYLLL
jgi:hypothetical protein